ncbi:serine/arginine repetitive matrix protein 1 [Apiospora marii]|uniref:Serine/arginine repetitive matrix protein 1 n=1 Tax=Apiospora marii TaxID=335849 RepID=A0ABR1RA33_9PEZI
MAYRGRSRSPLDRDRGRDFRDVRDRERRSPGRQRTPPGSRANNFRRRSPSMDRRDDRFGPPSRRQSPPRESAVSSAIQSRDISRRNSPHPISARSDDRSRPQSPLPSRPLSRSSHHAPGRERSPVRGPAAADPTTTPARSPPRGPAGYRAPPTGPRDNGRDMRDNRDIREQRRESISASQSRPAPVPAGPSGRHDMPSPSNPPSGPRGFAAPRGGGGGFGRGGGRGSNWGTTIQSRNIPPANGPASATAASSNIPTGPRASQTSLSVPSTPISQPKPFNPPKGPSADLSTKRLSFAEQLVASLPPIIPGGKVDPAQLPIHTGVLPELQTHFNQLKEEEEKIRIDSYAKQEKLRKSLAHWDKLEREAKVMELRSTLSEQSLAKVSGDGVGGAAF